MQCQKCNKKSATIHLTEIVNGQRHEMHFCKECAMDEGINIQSNVPINDLLNSLLSIDAEPKNAKNSGASCPDCGVTFDMIQKEGQLGCPEDYEVFEDELEPMINKFQDGNKEHMGKVPSTAAPVKEDLPVAEEIVEEPLDIIEKLKYELEVAVSLENYEDAAELRDKIKQLE